MYKEIIQWSLPLTPNQGKVIKAILEGNILICFNLLINDNYKAYYSYKLPLLPDLIISPESFTFAEQKGSDNPIIISLQIKNDGKAIALAYIVRIKTRVFGDLNFKFVEEFKVIKSLQPKEKYFFLNSIKLPRGGNNLRIEIYDVKPFEDRVDNNVFEINIFININNPPSIVLFQPSNGTNVDNILLLEGRTYDYDNDSNLSTIISGDLIREVTINNIGYWNLSLDVSKIKSGDYIILIRAFDGVDYSTGIYRFIRVDHPNETFFIATYSPINNISLIINESIGLSVNALDLFMRQITYNWSINNNAIDNVAPYYEFHATTSGIFTIRVEISNCVRDLLHEWIIFVRTPIKPFIDSMFPKTKTFYANRSEVLFFEISIYNPDKLVYTLIWKKGIELLTDNTNNSCHVSFEKKGEYILSVAIIIENQNETDRENNLIVWQIIINNTPPKLLSKQPIQSVIELENEQNISFVLDIIDNDNDALTYSWSALNYSINNINKSYNDIRFVDFNNNNVKIIVNISDGKDSISTYWIVHLLSEPVVKSTPSIILRNSIILIIIIILISIGILLRLIKRKT
jgi:hypothetical protein